MTRRELVRIWAPPAAMAAAIFFLSSLPGHVYPSHTEAASRLVHVAEFTLLSFLLARALGKTFPSSGDLLPVAFSLGFCVLYGLADEVHQLWVPQRVFDLWDLACDALGGALGVAAYRVGRWAFPRLGGSG